MPTEMPVAAPADDVNDGECRAKAALPSLGLLRVTGEDATDFLHGQFTADLKRLAPGQGGLAAWCNPKGRVLFLLEVLNGGDEGWYLLAPANDLPALAKRLRMYVLRARVRIEDLAEDWRVIGFAGSAVPDDLEAPGATARADGAWLWRRSAVPALAYVFGPRQVVAVLWDGSAAAAVDEAHWEAFEIEALRPRVGAPLAERFLPQELDLEHLQGVHFDKGCYPGQEVIARLKYRGQVKSGLRGARSEGPAAPGDRIYREDVQASVGDVLRVAPGADGGCTLLAVLDFDAVGIPLRLRDAQGPRVMSDV